jgi:Mannosyl-glycoprotein endo-beta-N-acetylglucosaminidase
MFMKNLFLILAFIALTLSTSAKNSSNTPTIHHYILKYGHIAQTESFKSGIPASIILAQAILESGFGNSDLSKRSNNHFGIKWKSKEDGDFVSALDDDYDKDGKRIASRFVKYDSPIASFRHHSRFISQKRHYRPLFKYGRTDFINWAYGLKVCGYSTDSDYGTKLIKLIRLYNLDSYDNCYLDKTTNPGSKKENAQRIHTSPTKTSQLHILYKFLKTQGQCLEESMCKGEIKYTPLLKKSLNYCPDEPQMPESQKVIWTIELACLFQRSNIYHDIDKELFLDS